MKTRNLLVALVASVGFLGLLAASPVNNNKVNEKVRWVGPKASPCTLSVSPVSRTASTDIDYIWVTNTNGGTATTASMEIKRFNIVYPDTTQDTLVVYRQFLTGTASPSFSNLLAPPSGVYKSNEGDSLRIIVVMASANSLYVACKYHEGR